MATFFPEPHFIGCFKGPSIFHLSLLTVLTRLTPVSAASAAAPASKMRCTSATCICRAQCPHCLNLCQSCFLCKKKKKKGEQQLFSTMENWHLDFIDLLYILEVVPLHQDDVTPDELHSPWRFIVLGKLKQTFLLYYFVQISKSLLLFLLLSYNFCFLQSTSLFYYSILLT